MTNKNTIYAIGYYDSELEVRLYPDTHLFVMNNVVKAVYAMTVFAGKLNDDSICLVELGTLDDDLTLSNGIKQVVTTFDGVVDFLSKLSDDTFVNSGISYKSFLNHYNVIISHINTFRASLAGSVKGDTDE